jgi:hypothetical protein
MWALLIAVIITGVIGTLIYFSLRKGSQNIENVINQKYGTLLNLLKQEQQVVYEKQNSKSTVIKIRENRDFQQYTLTEVDGRLIVVWTFESVSHGKRGKEWSFNPGTDQLTVFQEIKNGLADYRKNLHRER